MRTLSVTKAKKAIQSQPITALILGSGHNPRLRNCGAKACLVMPDSRYLLNHQLDIIKRFTSDIYMTIGYDADRVIERKFELRLIENQRYEETGEAEDLRLFFNLCKPERLLVLSGDLYLRMSILSDVTCNGSWGIACDGTDNKEEIGINSEFNKITDFSYSFSKKLSGLFMLEHSELELMRRLLNRESEKLAFWEVLEIMVKKGANIKPIHVSANRLVKLNGIRDLNFLKSNFLC